MIDRNKFLRWAIKKFGEENIVEKNKEICINTIFEPDDDGHHLWCSPSGGKKKREFGVFHCWKTDKRGSLIKLVQIVEGCDRSEAMSILQGRETIADIEKRLEQMLLSNGEELYVPPPKVTLTLPPYAQLISDLPDGNWWKEKASTYLKNRKIPIDGLYICVDGNYKSRIIIPYYNKNKELIYWNGRHLGNSKCKYLGPPKESGIGKQDVVYMAGDWPKAGELIYICEGEFNAKSLKIAELNGVACGGKSMSEKQAIMLSDYKSVICLDRDKAGKAGTKKMSVMTSLLEKCQRSKEKLMYVIPPRGYNDWNEFLVKDGPELLHHYIKKNQTILDYSGPSGTAADYFSFSDIWR
jgi:hypothetical protein